MKQFPVRPFSLSSSFLPLVSLTLFTSLFATGCSVTERLREIPQPEVTTTGVAAATGAVVGGGLGAIVGSESGSAGGGLAIGAVTGAAVGGLIGHQIEGQESVLANQKAKIHEQDRVLAENQTKIEDLKRQNSDRPTGPSGLRSSVSNMPSSYRGNPRARPYKESPVPAKSALSQRASVPIPAANEASRARMRVEPQPSTAAAALIAPEVRTPSGLPPAKSLPGDELADLDPREMPVEIVREENGPSVSEKVRKSAVLPVASLPTAVEGLTGDDCEKAAEEAQRAKNAPSEADKLFYYRRALRLCPRQAQYHLELGKIYGGIGRVEDAEYEFRQTLDLEPGNDEAKRQLSSIVKDNTAAQ